MRRERMNIGELTVNHCSLHGLGDELGRGEKWYLDGVYGSNGNSGKTTGTALKSIEAGESVVVDNRGDALLIMPAIYTIAEDLTWDKNFAKVVGLAGPAVESDWTLKGTTITAGQTDTDSVRTLDITGHRNQFYNLNLEQPQAAAEALTACRVSSYGNYFKSVHFAGMMRTEQDAGTTHSSLEMYTYSGLSIFEDCIIGTSMWDVRSAIQGQIYFSNTSHLTLPQDILFKGCRIFNSSTTNTNPAVLLGAQWALDRLCEFRDCTFYNFQLDIGTVLTSGVFKDACPSTHVILLSGTTCQYGWNNWADVHTFIFNATGAANHGTGGTAIISA